jgi:hypothetical protein
MRASKMLNPWEGIDPVMFGVSTYGPEKGCG